MDSHYAEKLSIEDLAERAGISQGYFMQLFKKMFGTSPLNYMADLRLEKAKQWLQHMPDLPLHEVGRLVGFEDENYFNRRFKHKIGVSPGSYRQNRLFKAVALNYHTFGYLLALQIIPSGALLDPRYVREYYDQYGENVTLHIDDLPDQEAVLLALAAHKPDVIVIRANMPKEQVRKLQRLASVLVLPWEPSVEWREMFWHTAAFLHKEAQAERWLVQYERRKEQVRQQLADQVRNDRLLILGVTDHGLLLAGNRHAGSVLYNDLGFTPAYVPPTALHTITANDLAALDAQRILLIADGGEQAKQSLTELTNSPIWRELSAVRHNKVHQVARGLWFEYTPHAHWWSLHEARKVFTHPTNCANES